jgi:hypothetical protein
MATRKRLGEVLHERGHVSVHDLNSVLRDQRGKIGHWGELLLQRGLVSKKDLVAALGEVTPVPYVDCTTMEVSADVLSAIPAAMARKCNLLPINLEGNKLTVAMTEPQNVQVIDELRFKTGRDVVPLLSFHAELRGALDRLYGLEKEPSGGSSLSPLPTEVPDSIEFISSSEQKRNAEAMREMQAELLQACHQELAGPHAFCPHCGERASPSAISEAPDKKLQEQEMVHR